MTGQDWSTLAAALRRHTPDIKLTDEGAPLLALLLDRDPGLLTLALDAYRLGYYTAVGERDDDAALREALGEDVAEDGWPTESAAWPHTTVLTVETRHRKSGGGKVALELDGHLFLSIAEWSTDEELERARAQTEALLRRRLGLAPAVPAVETARDYDPTVYGGADRWVRSAVYPDGIDEPSEPIAAIWYLMRGGTAPRVWEPPAAFSSRYPGSRYPHTLRHQVLPGRPEEVGVDGPDTDTYQVGPGQWRPDTRAPFEPVEAE